MGYLHQACTPDRTWTMKCQVFLKFGPVGPVRFGPGPNGPVRLGPVWSAWLNYPKIILKFRKKFLS